MLVNDLDLALVVVERALFEAGVAVGYLRDHSDRHRDGAVFLAYTHLKEMEDFPDAVGVVAEREEILSRMPADVVQTARARISTRPFTWTGVSLRKAAEIAHMTG